MGRGRQKAKQTKVARELKYHSSSIDVNALQRELTGGAVYQPPPPPVVDDDDDAVRIANDSNYGLGGGIVSASLERSLAVAHRVRTGILSINGGMPYGADLPFGGFKDSGIGRQNGTAGFDQYLETKSLAWPTS